MVARINKVATITLMLVENFINSVVNIIYSGMVKMSSATLEVAPKMKASRWDLT